MARRRVVLSPEVGGTIFPEEIMVEILSKMDVKSLSQFKLVNRRWENLLSSRFFIMKKHLVEMKKKKKNVGFVLQIRYGYYQLGYEKTPPGVPLSKSLLDGDPDVDFLASCNGMVVYCNLSDEFFIWNPVTDENAQIQSTTIDFTMASMGASVFFGLGYDGGADEYKLMRIAVFSAPIFENEVKVLSFRTMEWRRVGDFSWEYPVANPGVFARDCLNFLVTEPNKLLGIATFNCSTEEYGFIQLPPRLESLQYYAELSALDDDRIVLYSSMCMSFNLFEMWIMENHMKQDSWRRILFSANCPIIANDMVISLQPLRLLKLENEKILMRVEPMGIIIIYDMVCGTYALLDGPVAGAEYFTVFPYVQSLESPSMLVG